MGATSRNQVNRSAGCQPDQTSAIAKIVHKQIWNLRSLPAIVIAFPSAGQPVAESETFAQRSAIFDQGQNVN